jgi:hypothetical protein
MPYHFRLYLATTEATASLIPLLRRHTGRPISDLRNAITNQKPFLDEKPLHNQYSEFIDRVVSMLDDLESEGVRYLVEVDGSPECPQYLRNLFQRWHDIGEQTQRITDIESGEPCIETLEWLKHNAPSDVFQKTIKQIIDRDRYACDAETVAWARRQLEAADEDGFKG